MRGEGYFRQSKAGCLAAYLFFVFFTSFCKVRVMQRPALLNPPCLGVGAAGYTWSRPVLGLLFPADAGWQTTQAAQTQLLTHSSSRGTAQLLTYQHPSSFLCSTSGQNSASIHPTASSSCTKQNTASGALKCLSPRSQALHPAKHIHAALPVAGMLYK